MLDGLTESEYTEQNGARCLFVFDSQHGFHLLVAHVDFACGIVFVNGAEMAHGGYALAFFEQSLANLMTTGADGGNDADAGDDYHFFRFFSM